MAPEIKLISQKRKISGFVAHHLTLGKNWKCMKLTSKRTGRVGNVL
jgi:hypothetical protein